MQRNIVIVIAVIVLATGAWWFSSRQGAPSANKNEPVAGSARYCGSDGELVTTMPIQSHRSYCVKTDVAGLTLGQPVEFSFQVVDDQGDALKEFDVVHEKIMHVILVRQDLTNFQHLHPDFDAATGTFTLNDLTVTSDGSYRLFADFTPTGSQIGPDGVKLPVVDHVDVVAGSLTAYQPVDLGTANAADTVGPYTVSASVSPALLEAGQAATLRFMVNESGQPVKDLEPYLGELGHAVVLKDGDLGFLHTHPMDQDVNQQTSTIAFEVTFPEPGRYKTFMQFQHRGTVQTVEFILPDVTGTAGATEPAEGGMFHM